MRPAAALFASVACVALALASAPARAAPAPRTYAEAARALPKQGDRRVAGLLAYAHDARAPLADRVRAAQAARKGLAPTDARRSKALLVEAHLAAVRGKASQRAALLRQAKAAALAAGKADRAARIDEALRGDDELRTLLAQLKRGATASSATVPSTAGAAVLAALPAYRALGDERAARAALAAVGRARALEGDGAGALALLDEAVDGEGVDRDFAGVVVDAQRARAALLLAAGRFEDAARAALAADRAIAIPATKAAFDAPPPAPYARTRETAELCLQVRRERTSCAAVEERVYGARTFYDFSREGRGGKFDRARADAVLGEYESTLHACLQAAAKAGAATDTHVELEWAVEKSGRVGPFDLKPKRLRGTDFDRCLRAAFDRFRYPPYQGEQQHVALTFDVGA